MTELATIRWGDTQAIVVPKSPGEFSAPNLVTKQLVQGDWHVPMSWNVILIAFPEFDASETGTFTLNWLFALGAGGGSITEVPLFSMTIAPVGGKYALQQQQQLVPAQQINIRAQLTSTSNTNTVVERVTVGAFIACNNAEPFAEIDAILSGGERVTDSGYGLPGERPRWMPTPGFDDGDMRYQPYRRRR